MNYKIAVTCVHNGHTFYVLKKKGKKGIAKIKVKSYMLSSNDAII